MAPPLTAVAALVSLPADAAAGGGFRWLNLVVLVAVIAVAWPLFRRLRAGISKGRRERWAREEGWSREITPETDPDLRHDDPEPPGDRP